MLWIQKEMSDSLLIYLKKIKTSASPRQLIFIDISALLGSVIDPWEQRVVSSQDEISRVPFLHEEHRLSHLSGPKQFKRAKYPDKTLLIFCT